MFGKVNICNLIYDLLNKYLQKKKIILYLKHMRKCVIY